MATVQSVSNTSFASGSTTVTITKPTGLAVGDLMVAQVVIVANDSFSTPGGWTSLYSGLQSGGTTPARLQVFTKVADSADVAASNFSFTAAGTGQKAGGILRIDGVSTLISVAQTNTSATGASGTLTMSTQTPTRASSVFILFAGGGQTGVVGDHVISAPAMVTNNPTWTNRWNVTDGSGEAGNLYCASATRTEVTATGNATLTYASGSPTNNIIGVFVMVNSSVNNTQTPTAQVISSVVGSIAGPVPFVTSQLTNPTVTNLQPTVWTPSTKSSPNTWTNTLKS